jgi:hypothetical protein
MNYAELTQALQDYTDNQETTFVSNIPTFIRQSEQRIFRSVLIPELRKNVTGTTATGNRFLARPTDFLAPISLAIGTGGVPDTYLIEKDVNFIREAYPSASSTAEPKYYSAFDGDAYSGGAETSPGYFLLGPTPDADYAVELHYYYDPPSIVDTSTSWLGENADTALLYGALIEAYTFMKGEAELLTLYTTRYREALDELANVGVRLRRDDYRGVAL